MAAIIMPQLTNPRHERYAQELAKGTPQTEAYERAGFKRDTGAASRLSANISVRARVTELQGAAADKAVLSRAWVIERLMRNAERAMQAEAVLNSDGEPTGEYRYDGTTANRALELLGKDIGMFVDRAEVTATVRDVSDEPLTESEWAERHVTQH